MVFEWDETKSDTTRSRRGYGFDTAVLIFRSAVIERIDDRFDYGETRVKAIGETGGRIIVVIYTDLPGIRRIISSWPASRKDRALWQSFVKL